MEYLEREDCGCQGVQFDDFKAKYYPKKRVPITAESFVLWVEMFGQPEEVGASLAMDMDKCSNRIFGDYGFMNIDVYNACKAKKSNKTVRLMACVLIMQAQGVFK